MLTIVKLKPLKERKFCVNCGDRTYGLSVQDTRNKSSTLYYCPSCESWSYPIDVMIEDGALGTRHIKMIHKHWEMRNELDRNDNYRF